MSKRPSSSSKPGSKPQPPDPGSDRASSASADAATLTIHNRREEIEQAETALLEAMDRHQFAEASRFAVRLALEESLVNAFRHGHKNLPPELPVKFAYRVGDDEVRMTIEDQGPGFDPGTVPDPTLDENLERPTGRGLLLIRAYMASVKYLGRGNRLEMVYKRP